MAGVNNLFIRLHRWSEGALTMVVFAASFTMLVCGLILFVEDTRTSYMGLKEYQAHFNLVLASWEATFWAESIIPQIGQIVLFYVFFSDMRKNWWALLLALLFLVIDFYADLYHRTMGTVSLSTLLEQRTIAGAIVTLFYFTIGAEFFISMGWGLAITTMAPAIRNFKQLLSEQKFALGMGRNPQTSRSSNRGRSRGNSIPSPEDILTGS